MLTAFREWYRFRETFWLLVTREVRLRYRGSLLGVAWTLLNPLLQMAVYTFVFSVIMRTGIPNYAVFVLTGLLPWVWFSSALATATESILSNSGLIKKIYLPTELLPLVPVTSHLVNFLAALPVLMIFIAFTKIPFTMALLWLPAIVLTQFVFTASLAMFLAMAHTFYRDVGFLLGLALMVWFYLTPVLYPIGMVPEHLRPLINLDPLAHVIEAYRHVLLRGIAPSSLGLGLSLVVAVLMLVCALRIFNSRKHVFAEII